jgi:hypothetical protein
MNKTDNQILTSVKVDKDLFEEFKIQCIKNKFSLQKLTDRAIDLYMKDEVFRKSIHNHQIK